MKPRHLRWTRFSWISLFVWLLLTAASCPPSLTPYPRVTSFEPASGRPGDLVTIKGRHFAGTAAGNRVTFGGVVATEVTLPKANQLVAKVPEGAHTGVVRVEARDSGGAHSDRNFIIEDDPAWTFMVYMDGDNDLEEDALDDFLEMSEVGSSRDLNVVVQLDRIRGYSRAYGDWTGTRRFLIESGDEPDVEPAEDLGEVNMGDPESLSDFIVWAIDTYPAQRFMLVIWNHGSGWRSMKERLSERARKARSDRAPESQVSRSIATDDTDDDELYMAEVRQALLHGEIDSRVKLDVIGFDACLMGMIEVAFEIHDKAHLMVASENLEPPAGWPYDTILEDLAGDPDMAPRELAAVVASRYIDSVSSGRAWTQSVIDLDQAWNVGSALSKLTGVATEWDTLQEAREEALDFHPSGSKSAWGVDVGDFARLVASKASSPALREAADELLEVVREAVVANEHTEAAADATGLAVYFPPTLAAFDEDPESSGYSEENTFMPIRMLGHFEWDEWLQEYYEHQD